MPKKTLLAALALTLAPTLALAMGCSYSHEVKEQVVMSCADGTVYDADAEACVPLSTS